MTTRGAPARSLKCVNAAPSTSHHCKTYTARDPHVSRLEHVWTALPSPYRAQTRRQTSEGRRERIPRPVWSPTINPLPAERLNVTIRHTTHRVAAGNVAAPSVRCRPFTVQCRRV